MDLLLPVIIGVGVAIVESQSTDHTAPESMQVSQPEIVLVEPKVVIEHVDPKCGNRLYADFSKGFSYSNYTLKNGKKCYL